MARRTIYTARAARRRLRRQVIMGLSLLTIVALFGYIACTVLQQDKRRRSTQVEGSLTYVVTAPGLEEQIVNYKGYTSSFNSDLHIPNWVAWELTADEATANDVKRTNKFLTDESVYGCPTTKDYANSGYDRGHMAPAADMAWDAKAMEESFMLTNILPQDRRLNTNTWRRLEEKCRQRAKRDSVVVIVCGPVPGEAPIERIGDTGVAVPQRLFKVVISPYANPPRGIGFIMPNADPKGGMQACAVTIDEVERVTGHDFFSALPDELENDLESQCNFTAWSRLK